MKNSFLAFPAVLALVSSVMIAGPAIGSGSTPTAEEPVRILSADEALSQDALHYADEYNVDPVEAQYRLSRMEELSAEVPLLQRLAGESLAGVWFEHAPEFRLVVAVSGPLEGADPALRALAADSQSEIDVRANALHSAAVLSQAQESVPWEKVFPNLAGSYTSPQEGQLVLQVAGLPQGFTSTVGELYPGSLAGVRGVPVSVVGAEVMVDTNENEG